MTPTYRLGTPADTPAVYAVFAQAIADLDRRMGTPEAENTWLDPVAVAASWEFFRPLFEHLARTAEQFWVAEGEGQIVGYARATLHDGVRELTEFFVHPAHQAAGIGRELLARAFPSGGARRRVIVATREISAMAQYLKAGVYPYVTIYNVFGKPRPVEVTTDLTVEHAAPGPETLAALRVIDAAVLGFARDADHAFLLDNRRACLYRRGGQVVGYGYFGNRTGPIALLEPSDFPAVLARAETEAAERGEETFGMDVPLVNRAAVDHLLGRGFRLEDFTLFLMSDEPFGALDRYVVTSPALFL
jgi:GNAT superfamily N-acetyltransferase